jgi:hypothetical protein
MSRPSDDPNELLAQLEAAKNRFDSGQPAVITKLLARLSELDFTDPRQVIRFHEGLLFLRAFPHSLPLLDRVETLLDNFHVRIEKLQAQKADMSAFDDFDTSGVVGTTMQDTLSFDVLRWLAPRIPRNIEIAWDDYWEDYEGERARGNTWPSFIPLLQEDADIEANIPWQRWLDAARGRQNALPWLLTRFEQLPLPARQQAELYDSLRLPIRWKLENLKISRTRNWSRPRRFYFHERLIQRSEVSLARELAQPAPKLEKLSIAAAESAIQALRDSMFIRYRDLYGATLGDPRSVVRAELGRGVVMHLWGIPPDRRLPLRAYVCGFTLKNGVAINYFEAAGLCEWLEVGFNTFYTYRQGETAWIYAQALRCLRAVTGVNVFSIYPYQIGDNNEEAIDSGAFWFYRKLGFRSGRPDLQKLSEREEKRIAADSEYRTPPRTLKRLAEAHMFYEIGFAASAAPGAWHTFSTRNLGLLVNRRMASDFGGDYQKLSRASTAAIVRALKISAARWTAIQKHSLENWSLVLALIPDLARWSPTEKMQLVKSIRAKSALSEMSHLHQTQRHPRLRDALLRLGTNFETRS